MNGETIHLLYCADRENYDGVMLSLLSVMRRTKRSLRVKILTAAFDEPRGCPVEPERVAYMRKLLETRDGNSGIELDDVTMLCTGAFGQPERLGRSFTPYTLLRLFADKVYAGGRVLYLDADTMAAGDVGRLYDADLASAAIGGVRDAAGSLLIESTYINAGVLLLDIDRIKRDGSFERAREYLKTHRLYFPDQSAINYSDIPIALLPECFNEQVRMRSDTVIRHFCRTCRLLPFPHIDRAKPWEPGGLKGRDLLFFRQSFEEYLLQRDGRIFV